MEAQIRVLLVEDKAPLRRSLEKFLDRAGYAFDSCSTAREALKLAERTHHDVVIVEFHLPDADGSVLLEKLKRFNPHAKTIVISEYDFQAVAREMVRADVRSFLKKPFDLVELESALSFSRSKVQISSGNAEWKQDLALPGIPAASIFK